MTSKAILSLLFPILLELSVGGYSIQGGKAMAFEMKSAAIAQGADVPRKFTCDGQDVSPGLSWNQPPKGTQSLALIMDDPDAPVGTWVHWVLYDLPASARELPEGTPKERDLASGARQGNNGWNRTGYGGPCPPPGPAHRYFFKLYALDPRQPQGRRDQGRARKGDAGSHPGPGRVDRPLQR
jgi:Raf kinase inhibitor-like YbhB/YbcL family protein